MRKKEREEEEKNKKTTALFISYFLLGQHTLLMRLLTDVVKKTKRGRTPYHAPFFLPRGKEAERSFFNVIVMFWLYY